MRHFRSLDNVNLVGVWLTIGSFDGVHLGHQEIIRTLTAEAHQAGASAVVFTFFPHPSVILRERDFAFYLTSPEEKAALLDQLGVDFVITHPFDSSVAATPAREFMEKLDRHLMMRSLHIGYDFALGRNREGDAQTLRAIGKDLGYEVKQIAPLEIDDQIISSSRIRFLLGAGQVDEAARLLGRNYAVQGEIVAGDQRGQTIGFPTANLKIWKMRAIPAAGVYICRAELNGISYDAVTNIGVRPTFETKPVAPRVETHLLDFQGDIYGESLNLEFLHRLRGERRFASVDKLVAQIHQDIETTRKFLDS